MVGGCECGCVWGVWGECWMGVGVSVGVLLGGCE